MTDIRLKQWGGEITRRLYILCICILLLVGPAAALNPVNVAVTSSNLWVTGDNTDSAIITVIVTDGTNKAIGAQTSS